jgi:hypothetical protein
VKRDLYTKVILTIIAICLVWICVRDVKLGSQRLYAAANSNDEQEVYISGISGVAFSLCEPIHVYVDNLSSSLESEKK